MQQLQSATSPALYEIEVFRTDIDNAAVGAVVVRALHRYLPGLYVSVDLDDCDRVLRVATVQKCPRMWARVAALVQCLGVEIEALPD